ncbi:MAG: RNA polymerase sigma factor [Chloroflexota bacterium]
MRAGQAHERDEGDAGDAVPANLARGDLQGLGVADLARACQAEAGRSRAEATRDGRCSLELFRRAICERDERAWEALFTVYGGLVRAWIRRIPSPAPVQDEADALVAQVFGRFWLAVGPERLADFPTGAAVLKYLKLCAHSVVMDEVRARRASRQEALETIAVSEEPTTESETAVIGHTAAQELWETIAGVIQDEAERRVAYLSLVLDLRPREIQAHEPQRYPAVADVYRHKRNALDRLRRHPAIQAWA